LPEELQVQQRIAVHCS